jgi:hypothetical protein
MTTFMSTNCEEVVMTNLRDFVEMFRSSMQEVLRDEPSVPGKICGADFRQWSATQVFFYLGQMKGSVIDCKKFSKESYAQIQLWAAQMESEARRIFGKDYDAWYKKYAKPEIVRAAKS